jgi:hypothetical protein
MLQRKPAFLQQNGDAEAYCPERKAPHMPIQVR